MARMVVYVYDLVVHKICADLAKLSLSTRFGITLPPSSNIVPQTKIVFSFETSFDMVLT